MPVPLASGRSSVGSTFCCFGGLCIHGLYLLPGLQFSKDGFERFAPTPDHAMPPDTSSSIMQVAEYRLSASA